MSVMDSHLDERCMCQSSKMFEQRGKTLLLASGMCGILGRDLKNGARTGKPRAHSSRLQAQSGVGGQSFLGQRTLESTWLGSNPCALSP